MGQGTALPLNPFLLHDNDHYGGHLSPTLYIHVQVHVFIPVHNT